MHVLPVLDLLEGVVVRGVGGRRNEYRPIVSRLVDRPDAIAVARAFRDKLGLTRLYVADLDAILHERPNWELYRTLAEEGFALFVDAGLRNAVPADRLLAAGVAKIVIGLETWPGPEALAQLCARVGGDRIVFSLDLKNAAPLGDLAQWQTSDAEAIAVRAVAAGIGAMIVLDLAHVGGGEGIMTLSLCGRLRGLFPDLRLITGGGVRGAHDLDGLTRGHIDGALVASALHDGRINRDDLKRLADPADPTL